MRNGQLLTCAHRVCRRNVVRQRKDNAGGDHALHRRETDLLDRDGGTGSGHITRSSISRVMPNSCASGSATAAMPLNMMATAISPGSSTVLKSRCRPSRRRVHRRAAAHVRHDVGEDEQKQQRIHADADDEREELAAQHVQVAQKEPGERARILHQPRRLVPGGWSAGGQFRVRPVRS